MKAERASASLNHFNMENQKDNEKSKHPSKRHRFAKTGESKPDTGETNSGNNSKDDRLERTPNADVKHSATTANDKSDQPHLDKNDPSRQPLGKDPMREPEDEDDGNPQKKDRKENIQNN